MSTKALLDKRLAELERKIGAKREIVRGLKQQARRIEGEISDMKAEAGAIQADRATLYPAETV